MPFTNGRYVDAAASSTNTNIRVFGQKDLTAGAAYVWIDNKTHTWMNVVNNSGMSSQSGTVTVAMNRANAQYTVTWWNTYTGQASNTVTLTADSTGKLSLPITSLGTDTAAKIALQAPSATVQGRYVFYNNSSFDGTSDDDAIATDKQALLPGGNKATLVNITSYSCGINGIMVDIANLPGTPSASDFVFAVGNDSNPAGWIAPSAPPISITTGPGAGGAMRVKIIWDDNVIQKQWLQVTVLPTTATGLSSADVFYFGNAIGGSGDSITATALKVTATDEVGARNNPHTGADPALITDMYDFNRDKKVNSTDQIIARNNITTGLTALQLITVP